MHPNNFDRVRTITHNQVEQAIHLLQLIIKSMKQSIEDVIVPQSLPFLSAICWQIKDVKAFSFAEMLCAYETGWRYRGVLGEPSEEELAFIKQLIELYGSWLAVEI
jgi:hypothetical protein